MSWWQRLLQKLGVIPPYVLVSGKQYWAIVNAQDEIVIIAAYGESKEDFLRGWVQDEGERAVQVMVTV